MPNAPDGQLPSFDEFSTFKKFTAEKLGIYIRGELSDYPGMAETVKFSVVQHPTIRNMIAMIQGWMLAGRVPYEEHYDTIKWPDGVWQMFKENHTPHWFKEKYPVRWHEERIKVTSSVVFACPHLASDDRNMHVQFMATGQDVARGFRSRGY
jgi:hypothetical protein